MGIAAVRVTHEVRAPNGDRLQDGGRPADSAYDDSANLGKLVHSCLAFFCLACRGKEVVFAMARRARPGGGDSASQAAGSISQPSGPMSWPSRFSDKVRTCSCLSSATSFDPLQTIARPVSWASNMSWIHCSGL